MAWKNYLRLANRLTQGAKRSQHRCSLILIFLSILVPACCSAQTPALRLQPQIDERVELLSIVFRVAGNPEYNMSPLEGYTADIDRHFGSYKAHPAVLLARRLAHKNGVSFDAVMAMAVSLEPPPSLKPLVSFTATVPEKRWGAQNANLFATELHDFIGTAKPRSSSEAIRRSTGMPRRDLTQSSKNLTRVGLRIFIGAMRLHAFT